MKKLSIILLCALLAGLCACGQIEQETTVAPTMGDPTEIPTTAIELTKVEIPTDEDDPYSFLVKERYENAFSSSINSNQNHLKYTYFTLYDIDGNGTKELLLGNDGRPNGMSIVWLYTIQNGVVVQQDIVPGWLAESYPHNLLLKNGTIKVVSDDGLGSGYGYLRFEDGELKHKVSLGINENGEHICIYTDENGYERALITKTEYDRLRKEYEGDGQLAALDWKPLEEYGR